MVCQRRWARGSLVRQSVAAAKDRRPIGAVYANFNASVQAANARTKRRSDASPPLTPARLPGSVQPCRNAVDACRLWHNADRPAGIQTSVAANQSWQNDVTENAAGKLRYRCRPVRVALSSRPFAEERQRPPSRVRITGLRVCARRVEFVGEQQIECRYTRREGGNRRWGWQQGGMAMLQHERRFSRVRAWRKRNGEGVIGDTSINVVWKR